MDAPRAGGGGGSLLDTEAILAVGADGGVPKAGAGGGVDDRVLDAASGPVGVPCGVPSGVVSPSVMVTVLE